MTKKRRAPYNGSSRATFYRKRALVSYIMSYCWIIEVINPLSLLEKQPGSLWKVYHAKLEQWEARRTGSASETFNDFESNHEEQVVKEAEFEAEIESEDEVEEQE